MNARRSVALELLAIGVAAAIFVATFRVRPAYVDFVTSSDPNADVKARIDGMAQMARDGISETLANLKRIAES